MLQWSCVCAPAASDSPRIKPANIIVQNKDGINDGMAVIVYFGIARIVGDTGHYRRDPTKSLAASITCLLSSCKPRDSTIVLTSIRSEWFSFSC